MKTPGKCRIRGCTCVYYSSKLCTTHYKRWRRAGGGRLQPDARYNAAHTALKDRPMSVAQLAAALSISTTTARALLVELGASVLFDVPCAHGKPSPMYSTLRSDAAHALSLIHKHLIAHENLSADELALLTGINPSSVRQYMTYLHNAGLAHIARWMTSGRQRERLWRFGPGEDAQRPAPFTRKQISARAVERWEHDPDARDRRRSIMRRNYLRRNLKPKRDPLVAALFGSTTQP